MNRGMEIAAEVADDPRRSTIVEQVAQRSQRADGRAVPAARWGPGMTAWLLKGVAPYGEEPIDLLIRDGVVADREHAAAPRSSTPPGWSRCPAWSTCTRTCASPAGRTPRRSRPARGRPRWAATRRCCAMANTEPVADTAGVVEQVWRLGREAGLVDVQPVGAVTVGLAGERLAELGAMADSAARVRIFSDDGNCVHDPQLMRRALEYVKAFDGVIAQHAEEPRLTDGAQMHEGVVSARLGLAGWPAVAEEAIIARDVLLTEHVGSPAARLPRLDRRLGGDPALGQGAGHPGHRRGDPAPPAAHRRAGRHVRPGLQGQPAAADGRGRGRAAGRPGRRHDRRGRHRPRAARAGGQGDASGPRPGRACSGWRPRCRWRCWPCGRPGCSTGAGWPSGCRPRRPGSAASRTAGPGRRVRRRRSRWSTRPPGGPSDPAASACRSRNTPYAGRELPARVVATFLRGEPTVLDGKAVR